MTLGADSTSYPDRFLDVMGGITGLGGTPFEKRPPVVLQSGQGCRVRDVEGREYIDYTCGGGPLQLGYAHPSVTEAIEKCFSNPPNLELERDSLTLKITDLFKSIEALRFVGSESEAVHAAVRLARAFTKRTKVVKFEGHYHGWFDSVAWDSNHFQGEMDLKRKPNLYPLSLGQCGESVADLLVIPWNNLAEVEKVFHKHGDQIACVLSEPVIPYGGIPPLDGFLGELKSLCSRHGILFILDERITGFRWGQGGAQTLYGCQPDLTTFSHVMDGGLPMAAVGGTAEILDLWDPLFPDSWIGEPDILAFVAGNATLDQLFREDAALLKHSWKMNARLVEGIREIGRQSSLPLSVRDFPCCFQTYFPTVDSNQIIDARSFSQTRADWIFDLVLELENRGILIAASGGWGVSSVHQTEDIEFTLQRFEDALRALESNIAANS